LSAAIKALSNIAARDVNGVVPPPMR